MQSEAQFDNKTSYMYVPDIWTHLDLNFSSLSGEKLVQCWIHTGHRIHFQ